MENQFFVDSECLSGKALERKHQLESDPSSRTNHMEYMPGMEQIKSDVRERVMAQVNAYDYDKYTTPDYLLKQDVDKEKEEDNAEQFKLII